MPITPEYNEYILNTLSVHKELQESILRDIARRISKTGFVTEGAAWQAEKLQQSGMLFNEIVQETAKQTDRIYYDIITAFDDAETEIFNYGDELVSEAGFDPEEFKKLSPAMQQTWSAALKKTSTEAANLTKTTANTAQSLYITACDLAHMQIASGAFSYRQAIANAVKSAARQGVTVVYPSGHVSSLDAAVRRSVLTGINQTAGKLQDMRADDMEIDLMEITAHYGARPEHAEWQGGIVSRSGRRGYLSLNDIGYGDVTGFMGANCRHNWFMYFEGISSRAYTPEMLEDMKNHTVTYNGVQYKDYDARRIQRKLERGVRQSKQELVMFDEMIKNSSNDAERAHWQQEFNFASSRLKKKEAAIKDFCFQTGLKRDTFREQVFATKTGKNFGKSTSSKAVWAEKKRLTNSGNGGIINIQKQKNVAEVTDVHYIGKIDRSIFSCVTKDIITDEVIITNAQIQHIKDRHPNDYERYFKYAEEIIKKPDYIIEANKPNTALILKEIHNEKERIKVILRIITSNDNPNYKNSIITFMKINEKEWKRLIKNKKVLYKSE